MRVCTTAGRNSCASDNLNPHALCDKVREIFERAEVVMTQLNQTDSLVENEHTEAGLK